MSIYLIGDIHGCLKEFEKMMILIKFDPKIDTLWLTGDLINRGPNSLDVLRFVISLGNNVRMVLGNHDLGLISSYVKYTNCISKYDKNYKYVKDILKSPDIDKLINWLRYQPLLQIDNKRKIIMTHAGVMPKWDFQTLCSSAYEAELLLRSNNYKLLFNSNYFNDSVKCNKKIYKLNRIKFIINALTRLRYCYTDGTLEMNYKKNPNQAPSYLRPWFSFKQIISNYYIVFGHWSSLMGKGLPKNIYGLDTGCCWGGELTALHWEKKTFIKVKAYKPYSKK